MTKQPKPAKNLRLYDNAAIDDIAKHNFVSSSLKYLIFVESCLKFFCRSYQSVSCGNERKNNANAKSMIENAQKTTVFGCVSIKDNICFIIYSFPIIELQHLNPFW